MGVYIKGMEMPASCFACPFRIKVDPDNIMCIVTREVFEETFAGTIETRNRGNCPLVPVPPHGRLGDLDNFALLVLNWISTQEKAYPHEDSNALAWRLGAKAMANQIYRDVKAYPTIIPADKEEKET